MAIIGDEADKQILDLFMESLPESKSEIEAAYQSGDIELLIKAVHKLQGGLCYTNTPQLREAVETMEISLKNGETDKADRLYKHVQKAFVAFEKEYISFLRFYVRCCKKILKENYSQESQFTKEDILCLFLIDYPTN